LIIERLAQEADCSVVERTLPVFLVRISGNQSLPLNANGQRE
jgi:hypothetical protein